MITAWLPSEKGLTRVDAGVDNVPAEAVWIDAVDITREEETFLEKRLGIEMPTRAEMQEIEASSRLYREGQAVYMTSTMLIKTETESPETTAVTFILTPKVLVTLRYAEPWSFRVFVDAHCSAHSLTPPSPPRPLVHVEFASQRGPLTALMTARVISSASRSVLIRAWKASTRPSKRRSKS